MQVRAQELTIFNNVMLSLWLLPTGVDSTPHDMLPHVRQLSPLCKPFSKCFEAWPEEAFRVRHPLGTSTICPHECEHGCIAVTVVTLITQF